MAGVSEGVSDRELSLITQLFEQGMQRLADQVSALREDVKAGMARGSTRMDQMDQRITALDQRIAALEQQAKSEEGRKAGLTQAGKVFWTLTGGGGLAAIAAFIVLLRQWLGG